MLLAEFKTIYRKMKFKVKRFSRNQGFSRIPRRMVLYLSTKLSIFYPFANFQSTRTFDLGFWQTSKLIYRKPQYKENVLTDFKLAVAFPKKWFCFYWPNSALWSLESICHGSEDLIEAFDRLLTKFTEIFNIGRMFLESFKVCTLSQKIVLYFLTKFDIFEPCANTQSLPGL